MTAVKFKFLWGAILPMSIEVTYENGRKATYDLEKLSGKNKAVTIPPKLKYGCTFSKSKSGRWQYESCGVGMEMPDGMRIGTLGGELLVFHEKK
jgi:hypothetical protein